MHLKHANGVKALENMVITVICAWYAVDKEVYLSPNQRELARIVMAQGFKKRVSSKIVAKYAMVLGGPMF